MFSFGLVQFNFPPENLGELKASMALLLHTRMIPIFAPTPEDLRVRDQCGEHAMVLCGSRDGYWLFQDSYGLSRGEIGVIKVRKGRRTVIQDPIPGEEEAEADPVQEEYERNIEAMENEADDEELWSGAGKQTMYYDDLICDEMYNPIDPFGIRKEKEIGAKRKGWLDDAEKNVASFGCVETGEASSSHGCKRHRGRAK
ncbi:hypothetical protein DY000_02036846 [Brassica cretica]|uniref:Uncharacterized protein n=1 Tax=Brassica cretica TaxID=69181 RepID=A0ABQ7BCH9_BRACR|nr:hypothetical protein DY000_02036846 [Brassica cretica]